MPSLPNRSDRSAQMPRDAGDAPSNATTINDTASQAAVAALPRLCRSCALRPGAMPAFRFDTAGHSPDWHWSV